MPPFLFVNIMPNSNISLVHTLSNLLLNWHSWRMANGSLKVSPLSCSSNKDGFANLGILIIGIWTVIHEYLFRSWGALVKIKMGGCVFGHPYNWNLDCDTWMIFKTAEEHLLVKSRWVGVSLSNLSIIINIIGIWMGVGVSLLNYGHSYNWDLDCDNIQDC